MEVLGLFDGITEQVFVSQLQQGKRKQYSFFLGHSSKKHLNPSFHLKVKFLANDIAKIGYFS